jgi:hypothetical protein
MATRTGKANAKRRKTTLAVRRLIAATLELIAHAAASTIVLTRTCASVAAIPGAQTIGVKVRA